MHSHRLFSFLSFLVFFILTGFLSVNQAQTSATSPKVKLENPITAAYLKRNLKRTSPKLILTPTIERTLKEKLQSDPLMQSYYQYLQKEAKGILDQPLLKRELEGFRLLFVSRELIQRMSTLAMVYRIERQPEILQRIDVELKAVCAFSDWNPQHFLDIAEMSFGVALALDWAGEDLPKTTVSLAKKALIEKGIIPSFNEDGERMFWINGHNNWNAVCHGGMIAASLAVADVDPELAAKTISRALDKLPNSLKEYAPDGVYPEGPSYWGYGTSYTIIASNTLETAFGSDFGISESPGFMKSAEFLLNATAPSGNYFNFADSGDKYNGGVALLLSWFGAKTADALYFDHSFFQNPKEAGRFAGLGLVWLSQMDPKNTGKIAQNWLGKGTNPIAIFRGDSDYFAGMKGGKAQLSHGNMDAGTFVFDLNGVRWVVDPGNQRYYPLNKIGFNLAGHCQDCPRWTLLTKNNRTHSTITVNDEDFNVQGFAPIIDFKDQDQAEVSIDLSNLYFDNTKAVQRKFTKDSKRSLLIEDTFETNENTKSITWGLMTQAEVSLEKNGAVLKQNGKTLHIRILNTDKYNLSVISLDPPPLEIDKTMENLKRIEIRIPAWTLENGKGSLKVRLSED
tara:strand:- start:105 stop:1973 length:1869 start_codon:yes stop_codon:yes gene_type:complete